MADGIKYRGAEMTQNISKLTAIIEELNNYKESCSKIKQKMQSVWSGTEATNAFMKLDEIERNIQEMIDIQTRVRDNLQYKNQAFENATTGL